MTEDIATAQSVQELQALCAGIIAGNLISTHRLDEQRTVAAILPAMCDRCGYAFPLSIVHRDKPDFLLFFNGHSVGLEVTRFLAPALAHATATANRLRTGFTPTRFDFNSPRRSKEEMERAILAQSVGLADWKPIFDQSYVDQILAIVQEKKQKILFDGRTIADEYWLLIEEHHRMSDIQLKFVAEQSLERLFKHWSTSPNFARVLILSESVLVDLNSAHSGQRHIG
jgi:hypothetical protein